MLEKRDEVPREYERERDTDRDVNPGVEAGENVGRHLADGGQEATSSSGTKKHVFDIYC